MRCADLWAGEREVLEHKHYFWAGQDGGCVVARHSTVSCTAGGEGQQVREQVEEEGGGVG